MSWATAADVLTYTGASATDAQVARAQALIELYADVTQDADGAMSARDLRLLGRAVAYQAAWMASGAHPDFFARTEVSELDQDDVTAKLAHADALLLAPLASRCLTRLSWMNGTIRANRRDPRARLHELEDLWLRDQEPAQVWLPLPGGH